MQSAVKKRASTQRRSSFTFYSKPRGSFSNPSETETPPSKRQKTDASTENMENSPDLSDGEAHSSESVNKPTESENQQPSSNPATPNSSQLSKRPRSSAILRGHYHRTIKPNSDEFIVIISAFEKAFRRQIERLEAKCDLYRTPNSIRGYDYEMQREAIEEWRTYLEKNKIPMEEPDIPTFKWMMDIYRNGKRKFKSYLGPDPDDGGPASKERALSFSALDPPTQTVIKLLKSIDEYRDRHGYTQPRKKSSGKEDEGYENGKFSRDGYEGEEEDADDDNSRLIQQNKSSSEKNAAKSANSDLENNNGSDSENDERMETAPPPPSSNNTSSAVISKSHHHHNHHHNRHSLSQRSGSYQNTPTHSRKPANDNGDIKTPSRSGDPKRASFPVQQDGQSRTNHQTNGKLTNSSTPIERHISNAPIDDDDDVIIDEDESLPNGRSRYVQEYHNNNNNTNTNNNNNIHHQQQHHHQLHQTYQEHTVDNGRGDDQFENNNSINTMASVLNSYPQDKISLLLNYSPRFTGENIPQTYSLLSLANNNPNLMRKMFTAFMEQALEIKLSSRK